MLAKDLLAFLRENKIPVPPGMENIRLRVLIVEDEAVVALLMEETLQAEGFETRIATNGFEAGQLLSTFEPDVMTLDLKMPGMPGIEVLETLQSGEGNKKLGILVVSGMPENELNEALAKGADQAISKPFRNEDLLDCIKKLIEAPSRDAGTTVR